VNPVLIRVKAAQEEPAEVCQRESVHIVDAVQLRNKEVNLRAFSGQTAVDVPFAVQLCVEFLGLAEAVGDVGGLHLGVGEVIEKHFVFEDVAGGAAEFLQQFLLELCQGCFEFVLIVEQL
jgi:hypothetical protein